MGTVAIKWVESQLMVGTDSFGHPLVIGSWPEKEPEWAGLKPSDLLLLSAASCSSYDVIMIMNKQKEPMIGLEIEVSGEQLSEPPYKFTKIHMHYRVTGDVKEKNVVRAIELSEEKYCSVVATLRPGVEITHSYEILSA